MRTLEQIKAEIIQRFGFFPPFYEPAVIDPRQLENLWQQTVTGYIDNPIPELFKEQLAALLARYCPVPYCLVCHASALSPLGMKPSEILKFLDQDPLKPEHLEKQFATLKTAQNLPLTEWPQPDTAAAQLLLYLSTDFFQSSNPEPSMAMLSQILSLRLYNDLVLLLTYNRTCLSWARAHPELSYEKDRRAQQYLAGLLKEEPRLAEFFKNYQMRFNKNRERQNAEHIFRKTEKLFKLLIEGLKDYAIVLTDLDGRTTEWNMGAERIFGYTEEEVLGKSFGIFFTPEDREQGRPETELRLATESGRASDDRYHLRKDGTRLWVNGVLTAIQGEDGKLQAFAKIMRDITERKKYEEELGQWAKELEIRVEKRTQELAASQDALHQAQKLEAVGQLAGGVAHDFNNLITGILGISEDLRSTFSADDSRKEDIEEIIKAAKRAFAVTKQLLALGRRQPIQPKVIDLKTVITDLHKLIHRVLGEDIEIKLHLPETNRIKIDQGQLEQILMNLAINARDAMPTGGTLTLRTSDVHLTDDDAGRRFRIASGPHVMIEVSDTGHGMDKNTLSHLFEPFFTTKGKEQGTGLGLATVYGIVKQSGGDIHVYSEPGIGSSFKIYFPVDSSNMRAVVERPVLTEHAPGKETILVVEDEEIVRRVVVRKLRGQGYNVLEARNGKEVQAVISENETLIDLLVTDVVMPGMNGRAVADKIRERHPNAAILYMSGYPEDIIAIRGIIEPGIDFIEKAHIAKDLVSKVREVIGRAHSSKIDAASAIINPSSHN